MSLKKTKLKSSSSSSSGNKKKTGNFSVGDTVNFHGGTHYVSSDASSGYQVAAGKAKITHSNPGSAHLGVWKVLIGAKHTYVDG